MNTKGTYTTIQDWMLDLPLDVWETIIYAVIWGFTMDGETVFHGSRSFLARHAKCSVDKVDKSTKHLVELGLIQKLDKYINGVKYCEYKALPDAIFGGGRSRQGVAAPSGWGVVAPSGEGSRSQRHNNIEENIDDNIDSSSSASADAPASRRKKFSFRDSIISDGASADQADRLLAIRKQKRLTNSEAAYSRLHESIQTICNAQGVTTAEVVAFMLKQGWGAIRPDWSGVEGIKAATPRSRKVRSLQDIMANDTRLF